MSNIHATLQYVILHYTEFRKVIHETHGGNFIKS